MREKRREKLRHKSDVPPFLDLSDSEEDKTDTKAEKKGNGSDDYATARGVVQLVRPLQTRA
jgi:hypothetical protein